MIRVDVPYLFELAGGPVGLLHLLDRHTPGHDLNYGTVQMWSQRNSIPARWQAAVLYALSREGVAILSLFSDDEEMRGAA